MSTDQPLKLVKKKATEKSKTDFTVVLKRGVQGRVKWYSPEDAYGFIHRYDNDDDIFVHGSSIVRFNIRNKNQHPVLSFQQEVEFDVIKVRKGLEARCVSGLGGRLVGRFFIPGRNSAHSISGLKPSATIDGVRPLRKRSDRDVSKKVRADTNKAAAVEEGSDNKTTVDSDLVKALMSVDIDKKENNRATATDSGEAIATESGETNSTDSGENTVTDSGEVKTE